MRPKDIALSKVAAPGSAPMGPPPASVRSSPSSPSSGKASMPMMPFSDWKKISASFGTKAATRVGSPMPRLTRSPSFSSRATRLAIRVFSSMAPLLRDQMIDEHRGCHDGVGRDHPDRHDVLGLGQDDAGGHGHQGIEVPRRQRISQVADVVSLLGVEESEVGLERFLEKERAPIDLEDLLALLDQRARSGRGQHAAQAVPPARIRSASVPWGTSSTSISPASICRWVSGLVPIWLVMTLRTSLASISLPIPTPGRAVSLAMMVRSLLPWRTASSMRRGGVPTAMKPPIIRLAPLGIRATASATLIVFLITFSLEPAVHTLGA